MAPAALVASASSSLKSISEISCALRPWRDGLRLVSLPLAQRSSTSVSFVAVLPRLAVVAKAFTVACRPSASTSYLPFLRLPAPCTRLGVRPQQQRHRARHMALQQAFRHLWPTYSKDPVTRYASVHRMAATMPIATMRSYWNVMTRVTHSQLEKHQAVTRRVRKAENSASSSTFSRAVSCLSFASASRWLACSCSCAATVSKSTSVSRDAFRASIALSRPSTRMSLSVLVSLAAAAIAILLSWLACALFFWRLVSLVRFPSLVPHEISCMLQNE
mmetsp:Transcript_24805/g.44893  ORF Transcript_24805/g.44893 Transcript_24805/m.44893 type:complete len:275 (+) Transcript_24805:495-1319(+)